MQGYSKLFAPPADAYAEALRKTYLWIETFIAAQGHAPTVTEIAAGSNLTYAGAYGRLRTMQKLGWIVRSGRKRDIELKGMKE